VGSGRSLDGGFRRFGVAAGSGACADALAAAAAVGPGGAAGVMAVARRHSPVVAPVGRRVHVRSLDKAAMPRWRVLTAMRV